MSSSRRRRQDSARDIRDILRAAILDGAYTGRILPSEDELRVQYAASRNVMREALSLLRGEGLIERRQGVGTRSTHTVVQHTQQRLRAIGGDTESTAAGGPVEYRLLAWDDVTAVGHLATSFGEGAPLVRWERLTVGSEPINLWTSYMPARAGLVAPAAVTRPPEGGTFEYFERCGVDVGSAHLRTGAVAADAGLAAVLECAPGDPVLFQHRRTFDRDGAVVEVATGYFRGDQIVLTSEVARPSPAAG